MGLGKYFRKRRFTETPEPKGERKTTPSKKLAFVVQEHHATALHYDFRIEIDGVLKSWAVPKGPSLNPHDHHLAIQTEDHPYDYRKFEGVIPEGNYGAGNVIIWDEGWVEARADTTGNEATLRKELKAGHLTFILHGQKLKGEFALIKMKDAKENNAWLLVKKGDQYASTADITKLDESVKSHKRVDDLGAAGKLPDLSRQPKITKPWHVTPMFCLLFDEPFDHQDWLFELKWDGYRAIASKHNDDLALYSRNGLDFAQRYRPVFEALHSFRHDVIVDGEIVAVDSKGRAHFEWLQGWQQRGEGELRYYVFDILWCDGRDLRTLPLIERKTILKSILPKQDTVFYSDHIEAKGKQFFAELKRNGLEGMVAKRKDSVYKDGVRGDTWLKVKTSLRQEVVIGGYTEPRGGRKYLGSLLVGVYDPPTEGKNVSLRYVGHSGGGIGDNERKALLNMLSKLERKASPFKIEPRPNAPVHWVAPKLVCEMSFSEWTEEGYMRHPKFEGMRSDKQPKEVHKETAKHAAKKPAQSQPELTHLDKVFFPKHKYAKGDLIRYYESVADYILPYLKDRPCSMNRMPDGITGPSFYQKNNEHLPEWVPHADIFSDSNNENLRWIVGGDLPTLLYMVQLGCVEINPWNSRVGHLDRPDWAVIDLDPEGISFEKVIEAAQIVHKICNEWKIPAYPKTSGKTGIHIFIPLGAKYTHEQAKNFAHLIALEVNKRLPKTTSVERLPEKRKHKIYVDFLQNREGQTLASPYSVRPTPDASVAMPLHWDEVKPGLKPTDFTIQNALRRLNRTGDLWRPVLGKGVNLTHVLAHIKDV